MKNDIGWPAIGLMLLATACSDPTGNGTRTSGAVAEISRLKASSTTTGEYPSEEEFDGQSVDVWVISQASGVDPISWTPHSP